MDRQILPGTDFLRSLQVLDRLEVGPVSVEAKRLTVPLRLLQNGREDKTDLIYTYEEPVFDPYDAGSQNLASMIAAQLPLNYGLFCAQMVFHGVHDETDRRFIREMAENTAREIYVNKFLAPNPFLLDPWADSQPVQKKTYLRATLNFPSTSTPFKPRWKPWKTSRARHAVSSSGGKESLLTYGLLHELGIETHPLFVNESGRHWFTALNAYRHFKDHVPHTSRVWVNSDRVFSWVLQHLPFIRKNFQAIRSDEYPIRLWTVAVFLFGILPLLRKREIGRLLIGDEYDTTVTTRSYGISHYHGLFDQSLDFDTALSRYFLQKGWAVSQFSILRPLSEMLIEKILAHRYPHLLVLQTSCHSAHKGDHGILPCGKCEKCRRIVGMLLAMNADPGQCGYTDLQIRECLKTLTLKGVSQEPEARDHMFYVLDQKGLLQGKTSGRAHPEVLSLRIHPRRSPFHAVPVDLRDPLIRLFQEHTHGTVKRRKGAWHAFDPLMSWEIHQAYSFEVDALDPLGPGLDAAFGEETCISWGKLAWPDMQSYIKRMDLALLPVGAIEQHGPHLPLDTDAFDAEYLARRVAAACSDPKPLVLPLIPYGVSYHHQDFSGTVSIQNDTLARMVYEIGMAVARQGIRKLIIINGHGGNIPALNYAAQMVHRDARIFVCAETGESSDVDIEDLVQTPNDVHAGEIETSTALAVRPHLVHMGKARAAVPRFSSRYLDFTSRRSISWYASTHRLSPSGILGDPTRASAENGRRMWEIMISHLVSLVEDLKHMTLDEIHHPQGARSP